MSSHRDNPAGVAAMAANGGSSLAWIIPNATVFVSSGCIMVIELAAGRIISKHLGASVYVWTSVIGIVLAGIAVGNYLGGLLADRYSSRRTLAKMFMFAAGMSAVISLLDHLVADWSFLWMRTWPVRVASHVACVFFLPTAVLGMISPIVAKMALDLGRETGRTIGDIYAWGVVGSIVGTFLAGYYLIAALGTVGVVWAVAVVLAVMAVLYWRDTWKTWTWAAGLTLLGILATAPYGWEKARSWGEALALRQPRLDTVLYFRESQYSTVEVYRISEEPDVRGLLLDTLLHSQIDMDTPQNFYYEYEKIYAAICERLRGGREHVDSLTIGGGGYVYPRYMDARWPGSRTDVAEIDAAVTEASFEAFGLPRDTAIQYYHEDGRVMIDRLLQRRKAGDPPPYDFIFCDAVNDYNVPFQLTTVEFLRKVRDLIRPDGAYLINMIDIYQDGLFLGALVNTAKEVFPYVYVFVEGIPVARSEDARNTFIIAGLNQPFDPNNLGPIYHPSCRIFPLTAEEMARLKENSGGLVLSDAYAPVENLLASVVSDAAETKGVGEWADRARLAIQEKDYDLAIERLETALKQYGKAVDAYMLLDLLGWALYEKGEVYEAVAKYHKALDLNPNWDQSLRRMATALMDMNKPEEALQYYGRFILREPRNATARYNFAIALAQAGRLEHAARQYGVAAELRPNFASAFGNWGVVLTQLGRLDEAIEKYRRAIDLDPDYADAHFNLAHAYFRKGDPDSAVRSFARARELNPSLPEPQAALIDAYYARGLKLLREKGPAREAEAAFREVVEARPEDASAWMNLGAALGIQEKFAEAATCFETVLKLDPTNQKARENLEAARGAGAGKE